MHAHDSLSADLYAAGRDAVHGEHSEPDRSEPRPLPDHHAAVPVHTAAHDAADALAHRLCLDHCARRERLRAPLARVAAKHLHFHFPLRIRRRRVHCCHCCSDALSVCDRLHYQQRLPQQDIQLD